MSSKNRDDLNIVKTNENGHLYWIWIISSFDSFIGLHDQNDRWLRYKKRIIFDMIKNDVKMNKIKHKYIIITKQVYFYSYQMFIRTEEHFII